MFQSTQQDMWNFPKTMIFIYIKFWNVSEHFPFMFKIVENTFKKSINLPLSDFRKYICIMVFEKQGKRTCHI